MNQYADRNEKKNNYQQYKNIQEESKQQRDQKPVYQKKTSQQPQAISHDDFPEPAYQKKKSHQPRERQEKTYPDTRNARGGMKQSNARDAAY